VFTARYKLNVYIKQITSRPEGVKVYEVLYLNLTLHFSLVLAGLKVMQTLKYGATVMLTVTFSVRSIQLLGAKGFL
jgi:hypothetical protein